LLWSLSGFPSLFSASALTVPRGHLPGLDGLAVPWGAVSADPVTGPKGFEMRHNGRPPIKTSTIAPHLIDLSGERPMLSCPECGWWAHLRRGMVPAHRTATSATFANDKAARCPASGQRVTVDTHPVKWAAALRQAGRDAALRRGTRVTPKGVPPVAAPVHRIAAAR
jgi:hypothetical protein